MAAELIVHIGLRKTGSSALQELLSKNQALLGAHGLDYPNRLSRFPAHQELAWALEPNREPYHDAVYTVEDVYDHYQDVIEANREAGHKTILSSEDLSLLTFRQGALAVLRERLSPFEPEIVYFRRDPIAYQISNYKHALFEGRETRAFRDFAFNVFHLSYAHRDFMAEAWGGAFGKDNVREIAYRPESFGAESILSQFLRNVFDITIDDGFQSYSSNRSIGNDAVDLVRALNASDRPDDEVTALKQTLRRLNLPSDDAAFLEQSLNAEERTILKKLVGR